MLVNVIQTKTLPGSLNTKPLKWILNNIFNVNCIISPRIVLENVRNLIRLTAAPSALCQASLCLVLWYDSWPGTDRGVVPKEAGNWGHCSGLEQEGSTPGKQLLFQIRYVLTQTTSQEGKSYIMSAQIKVQNCWFEKWWRAFTQWWSELHPLFGILYV